MNKWTPPILSKFRCILYTTTEDIIISIIKPHKSFSDTINQYEIAERYMMRRNEGIAPRRVRMIIEELIKTGYPIISTPKGGYCYNGKDGEALECYCRLRRQGIRILLRARNVLRNSRRRQLDIFEEVNYGNK